MRQDEARAMALLAAVVVSWGVAWPMLKVGVSHLPPAWFGGWRMVIGFAALFALASLTGRARRPARADLPVVLSVGLLQMAAPTALMLFALLLVDAGRASLLAFTHPLWVAPLAVLALGERLDARAALGLASGMFGLAVLFNPLAFDWSDRGTLLGNGLLLLSAMSWAAGIVHVRKHPWAAPRSPWRRGKPWSRPRPSCRSRSGGKDGRRCPPLRSPGPSSPTSAWWRPRSATGAPSRRSAGCRR
jgi:drug/metabolite transporter (DMT)-like permease